MLLIAWGLVSTGTMFVTGPASFYALRLLLGVTEAGFFPGVILYLTYWFPNRARGRMMGLFYLGVPLALILGGPLSGFLLDLHGRGVLAGWQWMFIVEGLLAVVVGFAAFALLDDKPSAAPWLPHDEKQALADDLAREADARRAAGPTELLPMIRDPRVLRLVLIYALIQVSTYGVVFYLPAEVGALLHRPAGFTVGMVSAIPWICALVAVYFLPRVADAWGNHRLVAALTLLIAGPGQPGISDGRSRGRACCALDRGLGIHCRAAGLLDVSNGLSRRSRRGGRHRTDRGRESGRILRAEPEGMGGSGFSFHHRRTVFARGVDVGQYAAPHRHGPRACG